MDCKNSNGLPIMNQHLSNQATPASRKSSVRWTSVVLPAEHGSWGLTLEPIALGLLVAPSFPGAIFGLSIFLIFLCYQPARILWRERRRGTKSKRVHFARQFLLILGLSSLAGVLVVLATAGWQPFTPFLIVSPLIGVYLFYDLEGQTRSWQGEISGAIVFSAAAAGIALADSWNYPQALALSGAVIARGVPSVLYIRSRIRLDKGKSTSNASAVAAHFTALFFIGLMVWVKYLPALSLIPFLILLLRSIIGLSRFRRPIRIKTIGFIEIGLGVLTVVCIALGFFFEPYASFFTYL